VDHEWHARDDIWKSVEAKFLGLPWFVKEECGCWRFTGAISGNGYGCIRYLGKGYGAHVIAYRAYKGPVPKGRWVLHTCNNPWCVNPDHLYAGTAQDNINDQIAGGTKSYGSVLKEDEVRDIKRLLAEGRHSQYEIADRFGVSRSAILHIKLGNSWRHV
jgi:hypothetical protein